MPNSVARDPIPRRVTSDSAGRMTQSHSNGLKSQGPGSTLWRRDLSPKTQAPAHREETQVPGASLNPMEKRPDSKEPGSAHKKRPESQDPSSSPWRRDLIPRSHAQLMRRDPIPKKSPNEWTQSKRARVHRVHRAHRKRYSMR
jgi:hypothetical protein